MILRHNLVHETIWHKSTTTKTSRTSVDSTESRQVGGRSRCSNEGHGTECIPLATGEKTTKARKRASARQASLLDERPNQETGARIVERRLCSWIQRRLLDAGSHWPCDLGFVQDSLYAQRRVAFVGWHGLELPESATAGNPTQGRGDPKLEALGLAQDQKKWRDLKATLLLIDEAGFSLVSPLKRSWSPRGQTPTSRTSLNHHQRLNLFGALLVSPKLRKLRLSIRSFLCNLRSDHAIIFLKQILTLVPGDIILVWDNHKIHTSPQTQEFLNDHPRIHEYRFPTCAPELNPVEFVWTQVSEHTASFAPHNIQELCVRVQAGVARTRTSKNRLWACLKTADLSWK